MRVINDFATGSEPDVLFFFNGADANSFIKAGKVVPLEAAGVEMPEIVTGQVSAVDAVAEGLRIYQEEH